MELLEQGIYTNNELFLTELYREIGEFDKSILILEKFELQNEYHKLTVGGINHYPFLTSITQSLQLK